MPDDIATRLDPDQLRAVMQHELAHVVRRDLWIGLLQQAAATVHWWNPLVQRANRRLADLREQICDDLALRNLPEPSAYAATLIDLAERCTRYRLVPATLGIGSRPLSQLESRVRHILSSTEARTVRLTRRSLVGLSAATILMTATILFAQVEVKPPAQGQPDGLTQTAQADHPGDQPEDSPPAAQNPTPTLHDLIQQMAAYERRYFPFDIQAIETFRFPDDLTPEERAKNLRADGASTSG